MRVVFAGTPEVSVTALRAIVYECEKNPVDDVLDNFRRLNRMFPS